MRKGLNLAPLKLGDSKDKAEPELNLTRNLIPNNLPPKIKDLINNYDLSDHSVSVVKEIGRGSQARVFKAVYKPDKSVFALKVLYVSDPEELRLLQTELLVLLSCDHPNIIRCYGFKPEKSSIKIGLEYMNVGPLTYLLKCEGALPEAIISFITFQLLKGLQYLHKDRKIIHRDLKPTNLLLNREGQIKISDFGISKYITGTEGKASTFLGTRLYMSPERLLGKDYMSNCDIWSLGLIVYEMALGIFPFYEQVRKMPLFQFKDFITDKKFLNYPDNFSKNLKSFLSNCLQVEPEKRKRARDMLEHPLIKKYEKIDPSIFKEWLNTIIQKATSQLNSKP